jgi:hypothetical protein
MRLFAFKFYPPLLTAAEISTLLCIPEDNVLLKPSALIYLMYFLYSMLQVVNFGWCFR